MRRRKTTTLPPARAELEQFRQHLERPLTPPRPWLKNCRRDPQLEKALRHNLERQTLCH